MQRRNFLKTGALAGSAFFLSRTLASAQTVSSDATIEIMLDEPLGTISPLIYSHFTEELGRRDLRRGVGGREIQNCEYRRHSHRAHRGSSGAGCPARRSQRNSGRSGSAGWRGRARPQYLRAAKRGRDQEGDGNRFGEGGAVHAAAFFRDPIHHYVGLEPVPSAVSFLTLKPS